MAESLTSLLALEVPLYLLLSVLLLLGVVLGILVQTFLSQKSSPVVDGVLVENTEKPIVQERKSFVKISEQENRHSYRIEEETMKRSSSEFTRRGQLWSRHASWHIPGAPRLSSRSSRLYGSVQGLEYVRALLKKFDVDPITGFLPSEDPLQRLPYARYHLWEDLGDDLPKLLGARLGQARHPLKQLPVLSTDKLVTDADLRRAHLLLSLFAHAYVWGGNNPIDVLPEGIAKPLWEVSERLGIPAVLGHTSIVLYNWRRLDANGDICMENLSTLNNFFDGRDESWFYLITVEIEARGAASIVPMMLALDAVQRMQEEEAITGGKSSFWGDGKDHITSSPSFVSYYHPAQRSPDNTSDDDDSLSIFTNEALLGELSPARVCIYVTAQLQAVAIAVKGMWESMLAMREGCHPVIFFHRVRPFLSGWKHNPSMPDGLLYEGVSPQRQQFFGGSAGQSSLLPFLDISLGVAHESQKSRDFLLAMRDYMLRPHREFLVYLETTKGIRPFVLEQLAWLDNLPDGVLEPQLQHRKSVLLQLREAYDGCVDWLKKFRDAHMAIVHEYVVIQQREQKGGKGSLENSAGGKGTGGTEVMGFLRPIRNDVAKRLIHREQDLSVPEDDKAKIAERERPEETKLTASPSVNRNFVIPSIVSSSAADIYYKDQGSSEDIDIFRGAIRA
eukprot:gene237-255_t